MIAIISAARWLLFYQACLVVAVVMGVGGCHSEAVGTLELIVDLRDRGGAPQTCEAFGAEQIELALFAEPDDRIATDRLKRLCAVSEAGRGHFSMRVASGSYARAVVRFISASGSTVRMCTSEGSSDAQFTVQDVRVAGDATGMVEVAVMGDPGRCPAE